MVSVFKHKMPSTVCFTYGKDNTQKQTLMIQLQRKQYMLLRPERNERIINRHIVREAANLSADQLRFYRWINLAEGGSERERGCRDQDTCT